MSCMGFLQKARVALFLLVALFTVSSAWAAKPASIEYIGSNGKVKTLLSSENDYCYVKKNENIVFNITL